MDLSKVNPILGYEMYTSKDKQREGRRSAYGIEISARPSKKETEQ